MSQLATRPIAGLLAAPFVADLVISALVGFIPHHDGKLWNPDTLVLLIPEIPSSYISALVLGVPLYFVFLRKGWSNLWQAVFGGCASVLPVVVAPFVFQQAASDDIITDVVPWVGLVGIYGAAMGLMFWLIAFRSAE